jgi:hypothetical protein
LISSCVNGLSTLGLPHSQGVKVGFLIEESIESNLVIAINCSGVIPFLSITSRALINSSLLGVSIHKSLNLPVDCSTISKNFSCSLSY